MTEKNALSKKTPKEPPKPGGGPPKAGAAIIPDLAAEVEENLGGSQPLREFLSSIGWS